MLGEVSEKRTTKSEKWLNVFVEVYCIHPCKWCEKTSTLAGAYYTPDEMM